MLCYHMKRRISTGFHQNFTLDVPGKNCVFPAPTAYCSPSLALSLIHISRDFEAQAAAAVYTSDAPGGEQVRYLSDNQEALELRLAMAEAAEREIILSTFDFDADEPGCQLLSALLAAADRGVTVKVLVDGVSGWLDVYASPCLLYTSRCV